MFSWFKRLVGFAGRLEGRRASCSSSDVVKAIPAPELPRVSTAGIQVVAMVGDYDRSRLPPSNDQIVLVEASGRAVKAKCGHTSKSTLIFDVYGVKITGDGRHTCPDCGKRELGQITIRCALCGLPILPGSAVSIYDIGGADIRADIAFKVEDDQVLGCVAMDCSLPGAFAGHWGGPDKGFVSAFN
jgi:hypothetical protein